MKETVVQLSDHIYKKILTKKNILMLNLFAIVPLLFTVGLIWFTYYLLKDPSMKIPIEYSIIYSLLLLLGFGLLYLIKRTESSSHNYLAKKTQEIVEGRKDRMFDPGDPESIFIVVVPRKNWNKTMIEDATDAGFLKISGEQLLFEGGSERWSLKKDDILKCTTAKHIAGMISKYFVVLKINDQKDQILERSFITRYGYGFFDRKKRMGVIKELKDKIDNLK